MKNKVEKQKEREWKKSVKRLVTNPELYNRKKENLNLYPVGTLSLISSISGVIAIDSIEQQFRTTVGIITGTIFFIGCATGILIIRNNKVIKKLKLERNKKYKQIIKDTKSLKNIEEKELVLTKKYKLSTINNEDTNIR